MARSRSRSSGNNPYAKPDAFAQRAKAEGYPARSVYKLQEIDRRCRLLRPGQSVLDLGCAPGSWLLYTAQRVAPSGRVRGVDLTPLEIGLPTNAVSAVGDVFQEGGDTMRFVEEGAPYDLVLSDMAPNTTGNRMADQARSADLVSRTLELAVRHLRPGGAWVAKMFMGDELAKIRARIRAMFEEERVLRPEGTRSMSYEIFLVGLRKRAE